jgi:hypothetical protein
MTSEVFSNQDDETATENLRTLKGILDSQYTDVFTVTLSRKFEELQLCESIFYDDSSFNICLVDKVKPGVLRDLLTMDRDTLMANYRNCTYESMAAERQVVEVNNTDAMFAQAQNIVQSTGGAQPVKEEKKNGGIFDTMFGGKKNKQQDVDTSAFVQDFNNSGSAGAVPLQQSAPTQPTTPRRKPAGFGGSQPVPAPVNNSMSFDVPDMNMSFDVPQSGGFDTPQSGGFDTPQSSGFDTPNNANNMSFDVPGATLTNGFDVPQGNNSQFDTPQPAASMNFDVPDTGFTPQSAATPQTAAPQPQRASRGNANRPQAPTLTAAAPISMPNMSADLFSSALAEEQQQQQRASQNLVPRDRGSSLMQAKAIGPANQNMDFNALAEQYQDENTQVKVVTKEVVREVIKEVPGGGGAVNSRYQNIINGNNRGLFLVTGDRRTGVTHTAITMANFFAQKIPTLYVDLDTIRHGSLFFLGLEDIVECESAIQNGLNLARNGQDIRRYAFRTTKFKFDSLISMPGCKFSDTELRDSLSHLIFEDNSYGAVIIDCPAENIGLVNGLLYNMDVFFCVDSDLCGCNNILTLLDGTSEYLDKKMQMLMRSRSRYLVKQTEDRNEFATNMEYLEQTFALAEEDINWARVPCVGTLNDIDSVCINLQ